jgi:BirA family biotin operon repressor/biotin-[acetyl-CoA-carboxylase] ligase
MSDLRWYPPSLIDEAALESAIRDLPRFGGVRYSVGVDSTQLRAFDVLQTIDALGISFVTESQHVGRGRAGRRWSSPPASGLLLSTILPAEVSALTLPAIGFWTSLAVCDAVSVVCGITLAMKWPNDLLLDDKKCAGILSEGRTTGSSTRVVVGVGVNVNRPQSIPADMDSVASWLSDAAARSIDRTELLIAVLRRYEATFDELLEKPETVIRRWAVRADLAGKRVSVKAPDGSLLHTGVVLEVAPGGALVLQTDGGVVSVLLGDVDVLS